jgi:hypothetical protein
MKDLIITYLKYLWNDSSYERIISFQCMTSDDFSFVFNSKCSLFHLRLNLVIKTSLKITENMIWVLENFMKSFGLQSNKMIYSNKYWIEKEIRTKACDVRNEWVVWQWKMLKSSLISN